MLLFHSRQAAGCTFNTRAALLSNSICTNYLFRELTGEGWDVLVFL